MDKNPKVTFPHLTKSDTDQIINKPKKVIILKDANLKVIDLEKVKEILRDKHVPPLSR